MDDSPEHLATPQRVSAAVKRELSQVKSMIKDLSLTNGVVTFYRLSDVFLQDYSLECWEACASHKV